MRILFNSFICNLQKYVQYNIKILYFNSCCVNSYFFFQNEIIASENGNLEVVKVLIERGANIDAKDRYGLTPLLWGLFLNFQFK